MANYLLSASSLTGDTVSTLSGEDLGHIEELMVDPVDGHIEYAVLSFGGFLGMGEKLFAIPFREISIDREKERVVLNLDKDRLKEAPGFDKDDWPDFADDTFRSTIAEYYAGSRTPA